MNNFPADTPYTYFVEFATEMLGSLEEYMNRIEQSDDPSEVLSNTHLFELSLYWLLVQHAFFKQIINDFGSNRWRALQNLLVQGKQILPVEDPVLCSFHSTYGATGKFILDKRFERDSNPNYFLILVDELDSPLFWPLSFHELAHCWLSYQDSVVSISSELETELRPDIQESRIEEALCDGVAAAVLGPSYVFSYVNRLWTRFHMFNNHEYPKNSFRVRLMTEIIGELGFKEEESEIESIVRDLNCVDWADEEIVDSLSALKEFSLQLPSAMQPADFKVDIDSVSSFNANPPQDIRSLYHFGWLLLSQADMDAYNDSFESINGTVLKSLERNRAAFQP